MTIEKDAGLARASMPLELKAGGSEGTFEGYGAIFGNVDRDGDTVARGAFAESLKARLPMLLWQHDTKAPIGRFDEVREDERGLYVRGRLSMSGRGAEAYELLRMGALDGLSIGFVTREATRDSATGTRTILKADLMEISLVTFPANELARITSVKSAHGGIPDDPRAFEHFLRDNGFSRTRARTITAKGFGYEPSADEIAALVAEVKRRQVMLESCGLPTLSYKARYSVGLALTSGKDGVSAKRPVTIASISPTTPAKFRIMVTRRNETEWQSPISLLFTFAEPGNRNGKFLWQSNANAMGSEFTVAAGMQEITVRGWTTNFPEHVYVTLY